MTSCLSKLKVTPSFCFAFKIPDDPTATSCYHNNIVLFVSDGSMLRTCASIGVDDCETANGVTYCYCKNELCNNPSKKLSNPNPGSGLLSSPQKSTELLIDTNKQKVEGEAIIPHEPQILSQLYIIKFVYYASITYILTFIGTSN